MIRKIKLITPPGMLITTAMLAIYCAYAFMIGSIEESWVLLGGGLLSIAAAYGVAMLRPWSRYLVYLLTTGFIFKLGKSFHDAREAGFFEFQFDSSGDIVRSLVPSALMVALSLLCCWLVYRHFDQVGARGPAID